MKRSLPLLTRDTCDCAARAAGARIALRHEAVPMAPPRPAAAQPPSRSCVARHIVSLGNHSDPPRPTATPPQPPRTFHFNKNEKIKRPERARCVLQLQLIPSRRIRADPPNGTGAVRGSLAKKGRAGLSNDWVLQAPRPTRTLSTRTSCPLRNKPTPGSPVKYAGFL